ncbi:MAG: hypothetical protein ABIJ08_04935 [Nanoarchaeota archaeon]
MIGAQIFNDISILEPRCDGCNQIIKLGLTTKFDQKKKAHVCNGCGHVLK